MNILRKILAHILRLFTRIILFKYKPKIIGITGSVGKTKTKDFLFDIYKAANINVYKAKKSFNSEIGVPLTIAMCDRGSRNIFVWVLNFLKIFKLILLPNKYPSVLILEMGVDKPNDMEFLASFVKPSISILTILPEVPTHLKNFDSREELYREKMKIFKYTKDSAIYNCDDDISKRMIISVNSDLNKYSFGFSQECTVKGLNYGNLYQNNKITGFEMQIDMLQKLFPIHIRGVVGNQLAYPLLAAVCCAVSDGIAVEAIIKGLEVNEQTPARMRILNGISDSIIIDDSYNSSPISLRSAIETVLSITNVNKKIFVLGDMYELGKYEETEHDEIVRYIDGKISHCILIGDRFKMALNKIDKDKSTTKFIHFNDSISAASFVKNLIEEDDIILVKGSQATRTERVVKEIVNETVYKEDELVRQESWWR